jgi:adenosylcobinamide-GDP ribazoletransferase
LRFLAAWRFLTIVPLPFRRENSEAEIGGSLVYFPVVGLVLGLLMAGLVWVFRLGFPNLVVAILLVLVLTVVTGAIHIDGLADTFDSLGGKDREERLQIMRDSHHGSFGVVSIAFIVLLKIALLTSIPSRWLLISVILFPAVGRWAMMYSVTSYPYARESGLGTLFKKKASVAVFVLGTVVILVVSAVLLHEWGVIAIVASLFVAMGISAFFNRQFGGLTGDNYGAVNEITEVTFLLVITVLSYKGWFLL